MTTSFDIHPRINHEQLASSFAVDGYVRIAPFLHIETAEMLRAHLEHREDWRALIGDDKQVFELDRSTRAAFTNARRDALNNAVFASARDGFQFRFESIRVPDEEERRADLRNPLADFARWMASSTTLSLLREITGDEAIRFADAQATAYEPGDFLTGHDDDVPGKGRRAAYVLGLTHGWRLEWGGLLLFHGRDGVFSGAVPGFNALDVFRVPKIHSVSLVAPSAGRRRLSVTGWLREGPQ